VKFLGSQLAYLMANPEQRANLHALAKYLYFLVALITAYAVLFHVIKTVVEHEQHSWVTGFYWTLVVMSTLGFGDITFTSDVGRVFSMVVLMSGVVFLLVMLPFLFISLFYAPWLEAQVRLRAPREVPPGTSGHVIITEYDVIAAGLVGRLRHANIPYFILEPDPTIAARMAGEGLSVIAGDNDGRATYERLSSTSARLLLANCEDTTNTNITLTAREVAPSLPIVATVEEDGSVEILELSGATHVLPLKAQLGQYLAGRVAAGTPEAHVVGSVGDLQIAELPARDTPYVDKTVRDIGLRRQTGVSIVGFWERGRLVPAYPHSVIRGDTVVVIAGTSKQIDAVNAVLPERKGLSDLVLVIGAGRVGQAAAAALKARALRVHGVDREAAALDTLGQTLDARFAGDAADRDVLVRAGIMDAASVLLTTNDDAMNIYLAVFCRRLNSGLRIVSRITHERNVEAIHRAGADFVLSYTTLGIEAVMSRLRGREPVLLGEGVALFTVPVPPALAGRPLRDSGIGSKTGLSVIALDQGGRLTTALTAATTLPAGASLLMLGSLDQRRAFQDAFEQHRAAH
jgi:Trk K+ transport system NAD-binding subunit